MKRKIFKNILMLFIALGWFNFPAIDAQNGDVPTKDISGTVVNESGRPLKDIVVYSSYETTITDAEGTFSIKIPVTMTDRIVVDETGYKTSIVESREGGISKDSIVLVKKRIIDGERNVELPFHSFESYRSVSATNVISGEELASYPTTSALEALSGRMAGLVIHRDESQPGFESVGASIRGVSAEIYVDGILRDPSDLSVDEIDKVEVIKDFSGRAALGMSAVNPVIFITTKSGRPQRTDVNVSLESGYSSPTILPDYLDAYNYGSLLNEARQNDGLSPSYSQEELEGYKTGSNPLHYPDVDYYDRFVKETTPFRSANINASGGDDFVRYFSMLDYVGTGGLESVGQESKTDRFKLRGNIDLNLTEYISLNVNLSGTYGDNSYPNEGGGADPYNMFGEVLSYYPADAHAMEYDGMLLQSSDYPVNLINELKYGGFAERVDLNTQNSTELVLDLGSVVPGLSAYGRATFDVNNSITNNKGGTEALFRHSISDGEDQFERIVEKDVETSMTAGDDFYLRRTTFNSGVDYDVESAQHELTLNAAYYQMLEEVKVEEASYQPRKNQDISLRGNYAFDRRYVFQLDLNYSGNMKLPEGERFNLFPTVGASWVVSNESFLENSNSIDYLKLFSSFGRMGVDNFYIPEYDQYYLHQTLWENVGGWNSGIDGNYGESLNVYDILQEGSEDYDIPKRDYFNVGIQGVLFDNVLSAEFNYFYEKNHDKISLMESRMPALFGTGGFLPATNFGEDERFGVDGFVQYSGNVGEIDFSLGANAVYSKGRNIVVDEPLAMEEHRKLANKETDLIWVYETDGLFQSETEVSDYDVSTTWGDVQPGDIKYVDFTGDGSVDQKDLHTTGEHSPRWNYGINLSLEYSGLKLFVAGKGVFDGKTMLDHPNYFWVNSSTRNFSEPMLNRWPETNEFPRVTTSSEHNYQPSTYWLRDASFFCLSNVELSYTIPRQASMSLLMRDTEIFARGKNLAYFSGLTDYGINPERTGSGISNYPLLQTITFGVKAKF